MLNFLPISLLIHCLFAIFVYSSKDISKGITNSEITFESLLDRFKTQLVIVTSTCFLLVFICLKYLVNYFLLQAIVDKVRVKKSNQIHQHGIIHQKRGVLDMMGSFKDKDLSSYDLRDNIRYNKILFAFSDKFQLKVEKQAGLFKNLLF